MKYVKTLIGCAVAMSICSFGAYAGDQVAFPGNQGQGSVSFSGTVVDTPCGISPDSVDQSVNFGQISKSSLNAGTSSVKKDFDIKLVNCTIDSKSTANITFSGSTDGTDSNSLTTTGNTNAVIKISTADNKMVSFDGTSTAGAIKLKTGDNLMRYSAWVSKGSKDVTEGEFSAVANFNITYQ